MQQQAVLARVRRGLQQLLHHLHAASHNSRRQGRHTAAGSVAGIGTGGEKQGQGLLAVVSNGRRQGQVAAAGLAAGISTGGEKQAQGLCAVRGHSREKGCVAWARSAVCVGTGLQQEAQQLHIPPLCRPQQEGLAAGTHRVWVAPRIQEELERSRKVSLHNVRHDGEAVVHLIGVGPRLQQQLQRLCLILEGGMDHQGHTVVHGDVHVGSGLKQRRHDLHGVRGGSAAEERPPVRSVLLGVALRAPQQPQGTRVAQLGRHAHRRTAFRPGCPVRVALCLQEQLDGLLAVLLHGGQQGRDAANVPVVCLTRIGPGLEQGAQLGKIALLDRCAQLLQPRASRGFGGDGLPLRRRRSGGSGSRRRGIWSQVEGLGVDPIDV
mmetsp:Transcript_56378/g.167774  ORF Transcript_56378/g.167774 Transcript_56378/m.167774 type:complete len:378 (-) Transcript_56378:129-1262(-)